MLDFVLIVNTSKFRDMHLDDFNFKTEQTFRFNLAAKYWIAEENHSVSYWPRLLTVLLPIDDINIVGDSPKTFSSDDWLFFGSVLLSCVQ